MIQIRLHGGDEHVLRANMPTGEHIFFLFNDGQLRLDLGYRLWDEENELKTYGRPNGYQAVIRNIGGRVAVIRPSDVDRPVDFPFQLDGKRIERILEEVREATED